MISMKAANHVQTYVYFNNRILMIIIENTIYFKDLIKLEIFTFSYVLE